MIDDEARPFSGCYTMNLKRERRAGEQGSKRAGELFLPFSLPPLLPCFLLFLLAMLCLPSTAATDIESRPRVALVLSGGGARGGAHIGVLRVLERAGVPVDLIVGASYGALIGGLYAAGYSVDDIERVITTTNWQEITNDSPDRRLLNINRKFSGDRQLIALRLDKLEPQLPQGIFAGQKIQQLLNRLTLRATYEAKNDFDRLTIPFRAIATDIITGDQVVLKDGMLSTAIRASIAVPGLFTPVSTAFTLLVDGGIANNLPVDVALDLGADFVIAVDCATPLRTHKDQVETFIDVLDQAISFRIEEKKIENRQRAHVLITPALEGFEAGDFNRSYELIKQGGAAAEKHLDEIEQGLDLDRSNREKKLRDVLLPADFDPGIWPGLPLEVVIDSIHIVGLERYDLKDFRKRIQLPTGTPVSSEVLDLEMSRLHATGLFQTVDYHLLVEDDVTVLILSVLENRRTNLGIGLHYDQDFQLAALSELSRHNALGQGSELFFRGALGKLKFAEAGVAFSPLLGPRVRLDASWWDQDRLQFLNGQRVGNFQESRFRSAIGLQYLHHSWSSFKIGYQFERVHIRNDSFATAANVSANLPGFWGDVEIDTREDIFLPTHGLHFQARWRWIGGTLPHRRVQSHMAYFASINKDLILGVRTHWAYVSPDAPVYEHIYVGGAGHFSMSSLRFAGLNRDALRLTRFVSTGMTLWKRLHLSRDIAHSAVGLIYQAGLYNRTPASNRLNEWVHGFGVGAYIKTRIMGPIRFEVVGTDRKDVNLYTAFGFAF